MPELRRSEKSRERRRNLRVTPDPLLVIRLASGNHGVVLDLSHGGVGFLAGAPVEEEQEIGFTITNKSEPVAEGAGRLMWKDGTGKRAGLKFTHLPDELREMLHSYLHREESAPARPMTASAVKSTPLRSQELSRPAEEKGAFKKEYERSVRRQSSEAKADPAVRPPKKWRFLANAVTVALACAVALAAWNSVDPHDAAQSATYIKQGFSRLRMVRPLPHLPIEAVLARFSKKPEMPATAVPRPPAMETTAASAPAPTPVVLPVDSAVDTQPIASKPAAPSEPSVPPQPSASAKASSAPAPISKSNSNTKLGDAAASVASVDESQNELTLARDLLAKDDPLARAKASQLLWQAVGKGNTNAEMELADLYLAGDVLPKNCGQARILLTAARNRKSQDAARKLADLGKYGCE